MGIGDVVEAKKLTRPPTNPRASAIVGTGLDLHFGRLPRRDNAEELVAGFLGLEVSAGPRNEFRRRERLTDVHGGRHLESRFQFRIPHASRGGSDRRATSVGVPGLREPGSLLGWVRKPPNPLWSALECAVRRRLVGGQHARFRTCRDISSSDGCV